MSKSLSSTIKPALRKIWFCRHGWQLRWAIIALVAGPLFAGCYQRKALRDPNDYCAQQFQSIEYPELADKSCENVDGILTNIPPTVSNYKDLTPWELTLEEAVQRALQNGQVLQKLGGRVVTSPASTVTVYDPAIQETDPRLGPEAALSAFDAQLRSSYFLAEDSQASFSNTPNAPPLLIQQRNRNFQTELSKISASGTTFSLRNISAYSDISAATNAFTFPSTINTLLQAEIRQPLLRGLGTDINRIAGPAASDVSSGLLRSASGVYNGVLIARINSDITLADFEAAVRDLVRDVERNYWELYYAYRDLDAKLEAREAARQVWENRKARFDNGLGRPDEEAQARQQYFNFTTQVENALSGTPNGALGVFGAERQLRRLMGLSASDGTLMRPISEPVVAKMVLDWESTQASALGRRVELRRQKWVVRQRELELLAAKNLNKFKLDFVGQYGYRGIVPIAPDNNDLFGVFATKGYNENWNIGLELAGPIGKRIFHVSERNAELRLIRDKSLLREQQKQILLDLNAAYTEVDRAFNAIKSNYNNLVAIEEELEPKRRRAEAGEEEIFFLLDAQQRATSVRTSLHRTVVEYNLALLDYAYVSGDLLDRYQISLSEAPWCDDAINHKDVSLRRFRTNPEEYRWSESHPVSQGAYLQQSEDAPTVELQSFEVDEDPQLDPKENQFRPTETESPQASQSEPNIPISMPYSSEYLKKHADLHPAQAPKKANTSRQASLVNRLIDQMMTETR